MRVILTILSFSALGSLADDVRPPRDPSWQLVWAEEFNVDGPPDPKNWVFEEGFVRNRELQWYRPRNAVCQNGALVFEARREEVGNPGFDPKSEDWRKQRKSAGYTSASIITRPELAWTFGRFEIRARFAALEGLWPAIWTTGQGRWPHAGEIDIMEFYQQQILANTAHAGKGGKPEWNTTKHPISRFDPDSWAEKFHLWVMEWDRESIRIWLDGQLLNEVDLSKTTNADGPAINPFHAEQRLRLNLAIGGQGGDPSKTPFPQTYEVDYVRVYQR